MGCRPPRCRVPPQIPQRIVSGGQSGVDRAALDVALALGLSCGGWCPRGRKAEDGPINARYPLKETPSPDYAQRTEWNVRDSDGTLILNRGELAGGTAQTVEVAERLGKPYLIVDLAKPPSASAIHAWVRSHKVRVLNIAGPREGKCAGIYSEAARFLRTIFGTVSDTFQSGKSV